MRIVLPSANVVFTVFQVKKKYGNMPFNLRNFEEEAKAKMGVVECVSHKLIEPFQVLYEKNCKYDLCSKKLSYAKLITRIRVSIESCPDTLLE